MRQAFTAGIASLGMFGSTAALASLNQGEGKAPDTPALIEPAKPEVTSAPELSTITPRMLLDERSSVMRAHEDLHRYFAQGVAPAAGEPLTTLPQLRAQLFPLTESSLTRALRPYSSDGRVAPLVEFTLQASLYHAAQQVTPQFVGSADSLAEAVAIGERSVLFCDQLTSKSFLQQATLALEDLHRAALQECQHVVAKQYPIKSLTGYSLRTALLEVIDSEPTRIIPETIDGKILIYESPDDLLKQANSKGEAPLSCPLNLGGLPPEVLMSVALKTGTLESTVGVTGSFLINESKDSGYLIVQSVWWRSAQDPKAEPLLVSQRAMTNIDRPEWDVVKTAVATAEGKLKVETLAENVSEDGKTRITQRKKGYLHLQSWRNDKNEPPAALAAFAAQWSSGIHPGFAAESKLADGSTVLSEAPVPLGTIFNSWSVSLPTAASRQPIIDRNQQALAAAECALAQEVRAMLCGPSAAMAEERNLMSVIDGTFTVLGNYRARSFAGIGHLISSEALRESLAEARELREVLCDLTERKRLVQAELNRYREALHTEADPINRQSIQDLRVVTANLGTLHREQLRGFGEFEDWAVRPRTLGPTDHRWMEQGEWERLRAITKQQPLEGEPYFALLDPRSDQPEELDGVLDLRPGTARLMMAIEASQILGREQPQSLLELRIMLNRVDPSRDEAIAIVPILGPNGVALGEFAAELGSLRERFSPEVEMLVKKGAGRIVLIDWGQQLSVEELQRDAALENELRVDLLGDKGWTASGMRSVPAPSADMQRKLSKALPETQRSNKARLSAFLVLGQNAALQGVTVPLGHLEVVANGLDSRAVAETLRDDAIARGGKPELSATPSQRLRSRPGSHELSRRVPLVLVRAPEGASLNLDNLADRGVPHTSVEQVLRDEVHYQTRRIMNRFFEESDPLATTTKH